MITNALVTLDNDTMTVKSLQVMGAEATFDLTGALIGATERTPADLLAFWQGEAAGEFAFQTAARARQQAAATAVKSFPHAITARYAGRCEVTGRRYARGARIANTAYGWALADAETATALRTGAGMRADFLTRQMDREDSMF